MKLTKEDLDFAGLVLAIAVAVFCLLYVSHWIWEGML